jgi:hypothetical protein
MLPFDLDNYNQKDSIQCLTNGHMVYVRNLKCASTFFGSSFEKCWRLTGSGATFLISYLIAGNFAVASTIATVQLISNTVLYFIHERIWNRIQWGKGV